MLLEHLREHERGRDPNGNLPTLRLDHAPLRKPHQYQQQANSRREGPHYRSAMIAKRATDCPAIPLSAMRQLTQTRCLNGNRTDPELSRLGNYRLPTSATAPRPAG